MRIPCLPLLALLAPPGLGLAQLPQMDEAPWGMPGVVAGERPVAPKPSAVDKNTPELANPGFEALDGNGRPVDWFLVGEPQILQEAGNRFLRVNRNNFPRQFAVPSFTGRHRTISVRARGELGFERLTLRHVTFSPSGDRDPFGRAAVVGTDWMRLFASVPIEYDVTSNWFEFFGIDAHTWMDIDDVAIFDEGLRHGNFEGTWDAAHPATWRLASGAAIVADATLEPGGAAALELPPGASAHQLATAFLDGQEYFVAGKARAVASPGTLTLRELWRDARDEPLDAASESLSVSIAPTEFLGRSGNASGAVLSRVTFENTGSASLMLDQLGRGFTRVLPDSWTPGPDSTEPLVEFAAAWPGYLVGASVAILPEVGPAIAIVPLTLANGTARGTWDGSGASAGLHTARFLLEGPGGWMLEIDRPLDIAAPAASLPPPPPLAQSGIARGAWLWLYNDGDTVDELRPLFAQAQADGFTFAVVFGRASQWAAVRAACDELALPFMLGDAALQALIARRNRFTPFSVREFLDTVEATVGPHFDSPNCMGFYLVDEPELDNEVTTTATALRLAAAQPDWKPAYLTISVVPGYIERFQATLPGVYWTDPYPLRASNFGDGAAAMRVLADHIAETVPVARTQGREYWLVAQAFADLAEFRTGGPAYPRATVGILLALGGKGFLPFIYRQINSFEGIRTFNLEPTNDTDAWIAQNQRVAQAESQLAALDQHAEFTTATGPILVTTAQAPLGGPVLFVVNLEPQRRTDVTLSFSQPTTLTELTNSESTAVPTGSVVLTLDPGDWRVWSLDGAQLTAATGVARARTERFLDLPLLGERIIDAIPVLDLTFSPDGTRLAAVTRDRVALLGPTASPLGESTLRRGWRARFADDGRLLVSDTDQGIRTLHADSTLAPMPGFLRRTGTSTAIAAAGDGIAWNAMAYIGVRRLALDSAGAFTGADFTFVADWVTDIVGPFADGSALFFDALGNLTRVQPDGAAGVVASSLGNLGRGVRSSLSPDGTRLLVARHRRGIALLELDANGQILDIRLHDTDALFVEDVAWIGDSLFAVADTAGDVIFHTTGPGLDILELARWRDAVPGATISALAATPDALAVGTADGRVILLGTGAALNVATAAPAWMLVQ
ncbi:MAG: hypothetical protein KF858_15320 [Candidatus Sumerlaeia bacterium]|nr:hypothetical protein [Candidatus Sumerlaeia bacterium]